MTKDWEIDGFTFPEEGEDPAPVEELHAPNSWDTLAALVSSAPIGPKSQSQTQAKTAITVATSEGEILNAMVPKALKVLDEVMEIELDSSDPNFSKLVSAKKDAAATVVNASMKADENRFRKKGNDVLDRLLAEVKKQEAIEGTARVIN